MGIKDLLRFMKPYIETIHVKKYAGQRVGIDAYSWLHKGAYSCSMEISLNMEGEKKFQYLNYFMHRVNLLRHYNITPVVVFDGGSMPSKAATQDERERKRKLNRDLAMEKLKEGNVSAAAELFQRAMSISPMMAQQLIQILRSEEVEFLVAPYEADAQLAYMSSLETEKDGIKAVISEDSDLLAYGCPSVIFKMDRYGNGEEIILEKVFGSVDRVPSFRNFDMELFTGMCVLAGCDFLPSVPGIGISKAHSLVTKYRNLDRVLSVLKIEKRSQMPESYSKCFKESVAVFKHARIYDASLKQLKHMKPLPEELLESFDEGLDFLGPEMAPSVVIGIARGNLNPSTMEAFNQSPDSFHLNPTKIRTGGLQRKEKPYLSSSKSAQESCFAVISSCKSRKEETTVADQKQMPSPAKIKHLNGTIELEKLMLPLENEAEEKYTTIRKQVLKLPDNNPFKRRKREEMQLEYTESANEQVSVLTEVETSEIMCVAPDSDDDLFNKMKRKRKEVQLEQTESAIEQVSALTEVGTSEIMCVTPDSQQTVESKPVNVTSNNIKAHNVKKAKRNNCDSSLQKNGSILNFFSPV